MNKSFKHIPKEQRKKIMLICDDIRVHSGVATVAKEIVIGTFITLTGLMLLEQLNTLNKVKGLILVQQLVKKQI